MTEYSTLFGPVLSRRFGRSLGVDLVPFKTCSQSCVFCQLGRTPLPTTERHEYVPTGMIKDQLLAWKTSGGEADVVTLAGSGEPTLHIHFGEIAQFVKKELSFPTVLLTNGTLLYQEEVCAAAAAIDLVKVTMSAWDQTSYERLHRPDHEASFDRLIDGEIRLGQTRKGGLWVEVFLVDGINTDPADWQKMARIIQRINPDRIHINTAVRPAAESNIGPVSHDLLLRAAACFGEKAEVIADVSKLNVTSTFFSEEAVDALVKRHPSTAAEIATAFGVGIDSVMTVLDALLEQERIIRLEQQGDFYFK